MKLTGKCLCGAIEYQINGALGPIVNCHCSMCRRWHGAAFRTRCTIESKNFKWTKGEEHLSKYHSSKAVVKTFCKICGSNLISLYDDRPDYIGLPIGGLDPFSELCKMSIKVNWLSQYYGKSDGTLKPFSVKSNG